MNLFRGKNRAFVGLFAVLLIGMNIHAADSTKDDPASGESPGDVPGGGFISVNYRRVPLVRVLDYITRTTRNINIKIGVSDESELQELERMLVTVELNNVSWRTAVGYIARKYRFIVNEEGLNDGIVLLERPPRVTLDVRNQDIANVIKLIAADAKVNIIIGPEVQGQISFNIHDVPWKDALDSILKTNGFIKVEEPSGIIRITTPERVQAQHEIVAVTLKYLQPRGKKYRPKLGQSAYVSAEGDGDAGDLGTSLLSVLNQIKSPEGTVSYEERTNMLIIRDTPTRIAEMTKIVKKMDYEPSQVKIKVRMVSQNLDKDRNYGTQWGTGTSLQPLSLSGTQWLTTFPFSAKRTGETLKFGGWGDLGMLAPVAPGAAGPQLLRNVGGSVISDSANTVSGDYSLGRMDMSGLQAALQLFKQSKDFELLQAPEVVTLDHEEATIRIGRLIRYALPSTDSIQGVVVTSWSEATPVQEGVQLSVVPHICGDQDKVILEVVPRTEDLLEFTNYTSGSDTFSIPQMREKVVVTKMKLRDMETGVIGGLITDNIQETITKVPLLGDLPLISYAFKNKKRVKRKENIMVFITPTIFKGTHGEEFDEKVEELRDQISELQADISLAE